jgi:uncharacterized protein involved in type VI secretion and phage assembly
VTGALFESIARIARHEAGAKAVAGVGKVVDLFVSPGAPADHAVSVQMRDSGLVLPRVPIAVGALGFAAIPAVGDLVVVLFLEGDYNAGVVVGRLYHPDLPPPEHGEGDVVLRIPPGAQTPDWSIVLSETQSSLRVEFGDGDVRLETTEEVARLVVGDIHVRVESAGGGRAELAAGGSTITLKKDGDISIKAAGNLKLEGVQVEISGSAKVKVSGAVVEVN